MDVKNFIGQGGKEETVGLFGGPINQWGGGGGGAFKRGVGTSSGDFRSQPKRGKNVRTDFTGKDNLRRGGGRARKLNSRKGGA